MVLQKLLDKKVIMMVLQMLLDKPITLVELLDVDEVGQFCCHWSSGIVVKNPSSSTGLVAAAALA
ncbi:hypothetical protein C5167_025164 [Papaver somniferum]|uniref:Uncharacterized protein n=1 Tax=Papaver somniferum TaxID=3469 RepID=A0A4Y7JUK9_PAPSO|nr:hypothetical protein C5167_025164 [Papaver somniferum]